MLCATPQQNPRSREYPFIFATPADVHLIVPLRLQTEHTIITDKNMLL